MKGPVREFRGFGVSNVGDVDGRVQALIHEFKEFDTRCRVAVRTTMLVHVLVTEIAGTVEGRTGAKPNI